MGDRGCQHGFHGRSPVVARWGDFDSSAEAPIATLMAPIRDDGPLAPPVPRRKCNLCGSALLHENGQKNYDFVARIKGEGPCASSVR
jgi:hypothetical protein